MPCGLCGSLDHNRSACPWDRTTQPAFFDDLRRHFEATAMNNDDTYHDELTAHLAAQEHPQPHPKRYDHGYIKYDDMRLRDFGVQRPAPLRKTHCADCNRTQCKGPCSRKSPGPITMHEPRVDWLAWAMLAGVVVSAVGSFYGLVWYLVKGLAK